MSCHTIDPFGPTLNIHGYYIAYIMVYTDSRGHRTLSNPNVSAEAKLNALAKLKEMSDE